MNSWHEQDEFWSVFEASIFDETQKVAAPAEVESILRLLAIEPPRTARIFRPRDWHTVGDATVLYERKPIDDWSRIENRWILVKDGRQTEWRFSHRIYAAIERDGSWRTAASTRGRSMGASRVHCTMKKPTGSSLLAARGHAPRPAPDAAHSLDGNPCDAYHT